jgi:hypothetical protein
MLKSFLIPVLVFAIVLLGGCKTIGTTSPPGPASVVENSPLPAPTQQTGITSAPLAETPGRQQEIWEAVRTALPLQVPVYIPAWLPPEFGKDVALQYARDEGGDAGPTYLVTYRSDEGDSLRFALGPVQGTSPNTVEPITVHGMKGVLFTTPGNPKIGVTWKDGQGVYHVQADGDHLSRDDLMRVVVGLARHGQSQVTPAASPPIAGTPSLELNAWSVARAMLPSEVPIYRPAWLPARFEQALPVLLDAGDPGGEIGPFYLIGYRSSAGNVLHFALGAANNAQPDTIERIRVRGVEGELITTSGWPKLGVSWQEGQRDYYVQASGDEISRAQLLRIVDSLTPVEQNLATPPPPGPPPTSRWDLPVTGLYLLEHPEVMQASDKGIVLTIHYIIVEGQEVTVFFSAGAAAELSRVVPETAWLRGVAKGGAGQSMSDNAVVPLERSVTTVEQLDNVTLGVLTFRIPENNLPLLWLEVPRMAVQGRGPERRYVDGAWTIPLLKDQEPGRPRPYTSQLFTTAPLGVEYDEVSVIQGDDQETNFAIGGRPEVTGGVDLFFVFTLTSPNEQRSIYLLLLTDGSIEKVTQAEYLARLRMLDVPPTPFPTPVSEGPDALETFAPPPTEPTPQVSLEEILKSFGTMTPPARRIRTLTPSPFVPPAGTPPSMPPTSTPLSSPGN